MLLLDFMCHISMYRNVNASGMVLVIFFIDFFYWNKLLLLNSDVDLIWAIILNWALCICQVKPDFFFPFYT